MMVLLGTFKIGHGIASMTPFVLRDMEHFGIHRQSEQAVKWLKQEEKYHEGLEKRYILIWDRQAAYKEDCLQMSYDWANRKTTKEAYNKAMLFSHVTNAKRGHRDISWETLKTNMVLAFS